GRARPRVVVRARRNHAAAEHHDARSDHGRRANEQMSMTHDQPPPYGQWSAATRGYFRGLHVRFRPSVEVWSGTLLGQPSAFSASPATGSSRIECRAQLRAIRCATASPMPFGNAALGASGANTLIVAPAFDRSALPADHRSGRGLEAVTKAVGDDGAANVPT